MAENADYVLGWIASDYTRLWENKLELHCEMSDKALHCPDPMPKESAVPKDGARKPACVVLPDCWHRRPASPFIRLQISSGGEPQARGADGPPSRQPRTQRPA